jgi:hypothetical protein
MKKFFLPLLIGIVIVSCKKEGCTDSSAVNYNEKAKKDNGSCEYLIQDGFIWKEDGGSEIKADSAFWTTGAWGTGIRAYKNGMANFFEINWDGQNNTSAATKTLSNSYGFTFMKSSTTYTNSGTSTIHISSFSDDKLNGDFTINVSGGSLNTISATFKNIPKK